MGGTSKGLDTTAPQLPGWRHVYSGKVRDLYEPADAAPGQSATLLVVASDPASRRPPPPLPARPGPPLWPRPRGGPV